MTKLINTIKQAIADKQALPFSVYSSYKEQKILNVPVVKPLLIFVLRGNKIIGGERSDIGEITCPSESFIFLSNTANIAMRNIPNEDEYFALLIEFDYTDFDCFIAREPRTENYFKGEIDTMLANTILQFVEWSLFADPKIWHLRRKEILQVLYYMGFKKVSGILEPPTLTHKIHAIISNNITKDFGADTLSSMLAMSESTLRRKLNAEGSNLQAIKDNAKLGYGLHLVQTSLDPIGLIAERCGYTSQSRFTDKFKQMFDLTPTELRKTRLRDIGE